MHIHIIGIAGTMTASLANSLKDQGHFITGSDQDKIYPPVSNILKKANIKINTVEINKKIDLVIVGSSYLSFEKTVKEFETVKKLNIPYISATEFIAQNIARKNSILVAGSYGKTTITSLISWILQKADINPSYMFGGEGLNKIDATKITNSEWSVIEADESIHGLDKEAKFLYYPVKYLILTSANWEHKDCYDTETDNFNAFSKLIKKLPTNGVLLINSNGYKTKELSSLTSTKTISYNSKNSDYYISRITSNGLSTQIEIHTSTTPLTVKTQLLGNFNFENILAAVAFADYLQIDRTIIQKAIQTFKGVKRRIQVIKRINGITFIDDFAQSAPRIKSTLEALIFHFPKSKLKVFFVPHASFIQHQDNLKELKLAFYLADEIVLGKISYSKDKTKRITANEFRQSIGNKLIYLPLDNQIIEHFTNTLKSNDIFVYMSSGGLIGHQIITSIINNFKKNV